MYVLRIGISDIYLGIITCRYWFDNESSYYKQEINYEWINFVSDMLESFTAFATLYMFHFYIKMHLKDESVKIDKQKNLFVNKNTMADNQNLP
jgi:hypothetical protein